MTPISQCESPTSVETSTIQLVQHPALPGCDILRIVSLRQEKKPKYQRKVKVKAKMPNLTTPTNDIAVAPIQVVADSVPDAGSPKLKSPTAEAPNTESPNAESPSAVSPSTESLAVAVERSDVRLPEQVATEQKAPEQKTPEQETPEQKAPEQKTPEQKTPEQETTENESDASDSFFSDHRLPKQVREAIEESGYTEPTPVQAALFEPMLTGRDVIAQAQTGSGKTAAFALPILANLKPKASHGATVLVLAPTRELAMQVAASFEKYAGKMKGVSVAAIYGGQEYERQIRALRRPATIVVGTPGRVIDHIKRGTLNLDGMRCLVLDEADEMLNMGFLEDVEFVLDQCPEKRQIALFSATMPDPIRRIADRYLQDPHTVTIESKTMTADSIRQRAIFTSPREKMDLLIRVLEAETTEGVLIFAKTKESTTVIADKLQKGGYRVAALNGDMPQATRQKVIAALHSGKLNIVVATDVAARGLDVPRISHVINFDMPHDRESYVHRIGRTGRAGRSGEAILFVPPSARGRLKAIEKLTRQTIEIEPWPSVDQINEKRVTSFQERITKTLAERDLSFFEQLIATYTEDSGKSIEKIAAALAQMSCQGNFLLTERVEQRGRMLREIETTALMMEIANHVRVEGVNVDPLNPA